MAMENRDKKTAAKLLTAAADKALSAAANSRCVFLYHQPKQPVEVKKFRKF
jgi:cyclic lactone autoinducer peptide